MSVKELSIDELLQNLSCKMTDCAGDKHYFDENEEFPDCRECGADLIDWDRVRKRDFDDVKKTLEYLKYECVRHVYWCRDFDQHAINYALRKGKIELLKSAEHRIRVYMSKPAHIYGKLGTSWEKNPIHYAQHATATCCRECMEKWYGVSAVKPLTEKQMVYFTKLVVLYLEERFSDLPNKGQKVPPIRNGNKTQKRKIKHDH